MTETRETVEKLRQQLKDVKAAGVAKEDPKQDASLQTVEGGNRWPNQVGGSQWRGRAARAAAGAGHPSQSQLTLDLKQFGIGSADLKALASAVQTTRSIIGEHA